MIVLANRLSPVRKPRTTPARTEDGDHLDRLRRLVWWLDESIRIPGTRIRIGLDPILGLIPGLGDAVGALLSAVILVEAFRRRAPRATLVRIVGNIILDTTLGAVPVLGDGFDAVWKSNRRNLQLLERHEIEPLKARRADRLVVVVLLSLVGAVCFVLLVVFSAIASVVMRFLTGL